MPNYKLEEGSIQWLFRQSRATIQVFGGAFANGKSTGMIMKGLQLITDYPGSTGLMARATYPKLRSTLQKDFFRWCPSSWVKKMPTKDENDCHFRNGSIIQFRYVAQKGKMSEDGSTSSNLLSATYDWIIVDQMEDPEINYKDFTDLIGRLRGQTPYRPSGEEDETMPPTGPRFFMMGLNPSQNWTYRKLVKPVLEYNQSGRKHEDLIVSPKTGEPIIEVFESDTYANRKNLAPDYIETLEATYKGQMRERYLLGKWAAFEGLVYSTFDTSKHLLKRSFALDYLQTLVAGNVKVRPLEGYDYGIVSTVLLSAWVCR
jgi:hypothetical protein